MINLPTLFMENHKDLIYIYKNRNMINLKTIHLLIIFLFLCMVGCSQPNTESEKNIPSIPISMIDDLKLSDTGNLTIKNCVEKLEQYAESMLFREGDIIPADVLIFIDFDDVYMSWYDFDIEVVCDASNYGVYHTITSMVAPNNGEQWLIDNE